MGWTNMQSGNSQGEIPNLYSHVAVLQLHILCRVLCPAGCAYGQRPMRTRAVPFRLESRPESDIAPI